MGNLFKLKNSIGLSKVSQFSRCGRANSRLPMKKITSLLQKTRKVRVFVWRATQKLVRKRGKVYLWPKLNHRVNFGLALISGRIQDHQFM